jgi:hypothetical protein
MVRSSGGRRSGCGSSGGEADAEGRHEQRGEGATRHQISGFQIGLDQSVEAE